MAAGSSSPPRCWRSPGRGSIYAFATAGDAVSDNAAMWTRIAGAVLGAFFLFIAYVLYRKSCRRRPAT